jgi:hypothetical protein
MNRRYRLVTFLAGLVVVALAVPVAAVPTAGAPEEPLDAIAMASGQQPDRFDGATGPVTKDGLAAAGVADDEGHPGRTGRAPAPPDHAPAHGRGNPEPPSGPDTAPFLVGAAATSADPEAPYDDICLGGYGSWCGMPMTDILHPLFARGLAVTGEEGEGETLVVVTVTAAGLFAAYKPEWGEVGAQAIRQGIAERTGLTASDVILQSDHSHASPDTIGIWGGVTVAYMEQLRDAAIDAGVRAVEARQPAEISVATVEGPPLRTLYDGPPTDRADLDFRVLFADAPDGERIATFVNYSPHATVLGNTGGLASGDWPAIAAEIVEDRGWGTGVATVGAIGATDWEERGSGVKNEQEARARIQRLLDEAEEARVAVDGDEVAVTSTFIREPLAQPILLANLLPPVPGEPAGQDGTLSIERSFAPPWLTGPVMGTVVSTARVGDVLLWSNPGEAFPQMQFRIRDGVEARAHFPIGAANDFLGYMTDDPDAYRQAFEAGTVFYLAGCPDRDLRGAVGLEDGCNDHWTLMVSPTIGSHVTCTTQDAAEGLGFEVDDGSRQAACPALTASDQAEADAIPPP